MSDETCRDEMVIPPMQNQQNDGRVVCGAEVESNGTEHAQQTIQEFDVNVEMKPIENNMYFMNNWRYGIKCNHVTNAIYSIITVTLFLYLWMSVRKNISENPFSGLDNLLLVILLYVLCTISGRMVSVVGDTPPPWLGMMLAGMLLKCSGIFILHKKWIEFWFNYSEITQSVILIMGCLELSSWKWQRFSGAVLKLEFFLKTIETFALGVVGYFIFSPELMKSRSNNIFLINYSSINSVLLISSLKCFGYFDKSKVYTLLSAASSLIDIGAVIFSYFSLYQYHSSLFHYEKCTVSINNVTMHLTIDIAFGIIWGLFMVYVQPPTWFNVYNKRKYLHDDNQEVNNNKIINLFIKTKIVALLFVGGCLIKKIKNYYFLPSSFSLACGISSFVAGAGWSQMIRNFNCINPNKSFDGEVEDQNQTLEVLKAFEYIWKILQPLFFGFMGSAFQIQYVDIQLLFVILAILVFVLIIHILITTCSFWGLEFNRYNEAFINTVWLPNSTLRVGCMAIYFNLLAYQQQFNHFELASKIMTFTLITTLVTTTLGAFAVKRSSSRPKDE